MAHVQDELNEDVCLGRVPEDLQVLALFGGLHQAIIHAPALFDERVDLP